MPEPKTYAPLNIKKNARTQFFCLNMSCNSDKLIEFLNKHKNEKGYVNLQITEKREVDQYGNTHSVSLDTWKPDPSKQRSAPETASAREASAYKAPKKPIEDDDVPF